MSLSCFRAFRAFTHYINIKHLPRPMLRVLISSLFRARCELSCLDGWLCRQITLPLGRPRPGCLSVTILFGFDLTAVTIDGVVSCTRAFAW